MSSRLMLALDLTWPRTAFFKGDKFNRIIQSVVGPDVKVNCLQLQSLNQLFRLRSCG